MENSDYLNNKILRISTAGSVDDGKSTLIGRLLYDSKAIFTDQYEAILEAGRRRGDDTVNLAMLTDGLRAERLQGITIDVAYRYFTTPKRKFILADTPGHIEYTRNMVTGSSLSDASIILIDARNGVVEQTRRHIFIAGLLRIPHVIICINKMDLVDYSEGVYKKIQLEVESIASKIGIKSIIFMPISALLGENIVNISSNMDWYKGPTLMNLLETLDWGENISSTRFSVQMIIRPQSANYPDYRGYAGRIVSGVFRRGDMVRVFPSGVRSKIKSIDLYSGAINEAFEKMSVVMTLTDNIDIDRGSIIVRADEDLSMEQELRVMLCWLNPEALKIGGIYAIKHMASDLRCVIQDVKYKININDLERITDDKGIKANDIAEVLIRLTKPLPHDKFMDNRATGSLIFIDENTNETVGAGIIV